MDRQISPEMSERVRAAREELEGAQARYAALSKAAERAGNPVVKKSLSRRSAVAAEVLHKARLKAAVVLRAIGYTRD